MTAETKSRVNHVFCKTARQQITHRSAPDRNHPTITLLTLLDETARHVITLQITHFTRALITFPSVPLGTGDVKLRRRVSASTLRDADVCGVDSRVTRPQRLAAVTKLSCARLTDFFSVDRQVIRKMR
jgi:hypothetical protein